MPVKKHVALLDDYTCRHPVTVVQITVRSK